MIRALLSIAFHVPGQRQRFEVVHQAKGKLASLTLREYHDDGTPNGVTENCPVSGVRWSSSDTRPYMLEFDATYDDRIFSYRPHHYGWIEGDPPLYYAVNAVWGGIPDSLPVTGMPWIETYWFRKHSGMDFSVVVGNPSRLAAADVLVKSFLRHGLYDITDERRVTLSPKAHTSVSLPATVERVDVKAPFRIAAYVAGRKDGRLLLWDHLFTYFR